MTYVLWGLLAIIALVVLLNIKKVVPKLHNLRVFFDEVAFEMTKVTWPTREETVNSTLLVLVVAIIMTILMGIVDAIFGRVVQFMF